MSPRDIYPRISSVLHGGSCSTIDTSAFGPGILLAGYQCGHHRLLDIDLAVRDRMQSWIDTDSAKMVASFEGEKGLRYGVLVFPSMVSGFAMTRTLSEDFLDLAVVPNRPLTLPEGVDTFIAVAGGQAIRFTPPDCWERIVLQHNDSHID